MTSKIKVDNINKVSDDSNIIKKCGSTITLGASGDSIALASGASQSGFGREGSVNWQTTPKTGDFTAVNGEGYFINTTSGAVVMTMPSGSAGAIVSIQDYNKTFDNNSFTVTPASGEKINGGAADADLIITTEGLGLTFVYVDGTVGWKTVQENEFKTGGASFITATGGTITTSGNCKIHTFTSPGTFTVTSASGCATNNTVSHLVVAGGGGGGGSPGNGDSGGGGGAGGYREVKSPVTPYTASPLDGYPSAPNRIIVSAQAYSIAVGGGGSPGALGGGPGGNGSVSTFSTITGAGGGGGGSYPNSCNFAGSAGGSGGGGSGSNSGSAAGGAGNTPPVSPSQGNPGGAASTSPLNWWGGGGGGAGAAGTTANAKSQVGNGGNGVTTEITASPVTRAGGGGGGQTPGRAPPSDWAGGGAGGSGGGGQYAANGTANTGGGAGGGSGPGGAGGTGGSGIVVIRYKFQ